MRNPAPANGPPNARNKAIAKDGVDARFAVVISEFCALSDPFLFALYRGLLASCFFQNLENCLYTPAEESS